MFDKPRKKSRWDRFIDWCYYNDFWQKVGAALVIITLIFAGCDSSATTTASGTTADKQKTITTVNNPVVSWEAAE